jgi:hypothetical protein
MTTPKRYRLSGEQIRRLVPKMGGCIATDRITVDGARVGSMMRQSAVDDTDTGWLFLAGDETQDYIHDPGNLAVYEVNTVANYDPDIIPYLYALPGQRFDRDRETGEFVEARDSRPDPAAARLPPGVRVVQGLHRMTDSWTIDLPVPFRRRVEDESLVLWRAGLTLWIGVYSGESSREERARELRASISPGAYDVRIAERDGLAEISYRVPQDSPDAGVPSLNAFVIGQDEHVRLGVYFDREDDLAHARAAVGSVRAG